MIERIKYFASMVKFSHTVFAMPFALTSFFYAVEDTEFSRTTLLLIILCMVFARNAAMGYNRYIDRDIDAVNPRTRTREIPAGVIRPKEAVWFIVVNAVLFVATALFINPLAFYLSPVALLVILGYSWTKRFTSFSHIFIGLSLSIAPVGAWIAVAGGISIESLLLAILVLTWVGGFDIIYSLQDASFDRENGLHSIPARFGISGSLGISIFLHLISVAAVWVFGRYVEGGSLYWIGGGLFCALLVYQHSIVSPKNLSRVNVAFGTVNGMASLVFAFFSILDLFI